MKEFIVIAVVVVIYFLPAIVAGWRDHRNQGAIFVLNLLLGWTVLGWIASLVWSCTGDVAVESSAPAPQTHVKCPDCAELVLAEARVCKHCGCKLVPQPIQPAQPRDWWDQAQRNARAESQGLQGKVARAKVKYCLT